MAGGAAIANNVGLSPTIAAGGTRLSAFAAILASALRGHTQIALGNIIGFNLFNVLAVLTIPGVVTSRTLASTMIARDCFALTLLTIFTGIAIIISRWRSNSRPGDTYPGRITGTLLVSCDALYYYSLHSTM